MSYTPPPPSNDPYRDGQDNSSAGGPPAYGQPESGQPSYGQQDHSQPGYSQQPPSFGDQHGYAAPSPYGDPGQAYGAPSAGSTPKNWMGIVSLIAGIVGVLAACFTVGIGGIVLGAAGTVFGVLGRKAAGRGEANNAGLALGGLITSIAAIVIGIALLVLVFVAAAIDPTVFDGI